MSPTPIQEHVESLQSDDDRPTVWVIREQEGEEVSVEVDALDLARKRTGLPTLTRTIRHGSTSPTFSLDDEEYGRIEIGPIHKLRSPSHVADQIALATGAWPWQPGRRNGPWFHEIANALLAIQQAEETDSNPEDITHQWVGSLARGWAGKDPINLESASDRASVTPGGKGNPPPGVFRATDDCLYIYAPALDDYVRTGLKVPGVTQAQITRRLAAIGFESTSVEAARDENDRKAKRRYWRSPVGYEAGDR